MVKCTGDGYCHVQSGDGKYHGKKKNVKCSYNCELMECACCSDPFPEIHLLACGGDTCLKCDMGVCSCNIPKGHCLLCKKKLVPIGTSRVNGKLSHSDWDNHKYHKKCWLETKCDD